MLLHEIFDERSIRLNLEGKTKQAVFIELVDAIAAACPECNRTVMLAALWEREDKMSTGIASGVAIPHAFHRGINNMAGAIGISQNGIEYGALDNKPVYVVFMLAMGEPAEENHLRTLNQIFTLVQSEALAMIKKAKNAKDIHTILARFR